MNHKQRRGGERRQRTYARTRARAHTHAHFREEVGRMGLEPKHGQGWGPTGSQRPFVHVVHHGT
eukprot:2988387-Prorocentrum_lima.AAC.1